jgi:surfactin synthase thioesterase subunit
MPNTTTDSPWFVRFNPRPAAGLRLFCFAHAGGGTAAFRPWALAMPSGIDVLAVSLPGRERRIGAPPLSSLAALLAALVPAIEPLLDRPFAFFGHSMGATLAFELGLVLQSRPGPQPLRLLLSGRRAPHLPDREPAIHRLDDDLLLAETQRRYGGIPPEVFDFPMLIEAILPALRADMTLLETMPRASGPPASRFAGPISVFAGSDDPRATREELESWQAHTLRPLVVRQFQGGHFYLNEPATRSALIAAVAADLRSA